MVKFVRQTSATPDEDKSYTLVPNSVLGHASISDRAFRLLCVLIHLKGNETHDDDDFESGNVVSFTRRDYEAFAEALNSSVRVLNATIREAVKAGLLKVERVGNQVTLSRGPAL